MTAPGAQEEALDVALELTRILEDEMLAIVRHDAGELTRLGERKLALVDAMEHHAATVATLPERTRAALARCREQNRRNGTLLEMRRRHVEQTLRILHGVPDAGAVYDDRGALRALATSRYRTHA